MLLRVAEMIERFKVEDVYFFRMAHIHCFARDVDLTEDARLFREKGIVPKYVERYVNYLIAEMVGGM